MSQYYVKSVNDNTLINLTNVLAIAGAANTNSNSTANTTNRTLYSAGYPQLASTNFLQPFGISTTNAYKFTYASSTNYIMSDGSDISTLCSPTYSFYSVDTGSTAGANITLSFGAEVTGIFAILIGAGGGGGGGGATSLGYGGSAAGGGGGGLGAVYIPNPGTSTWSGTLNLGTGGAFGTHPSTNTNGSVGSNGGNTTLIINGTTYLVGGGYGGGAGLTSGGSGPGGVGGNIFQNITYTYNGNNGSTGVAKFTNTSKRTMGGVGGPAGYFSGITYANPAPANSFPTPTQSMNAITSSNYTIIDQLVITLTRPTSANIIIDNANIILKGAGGTGLENAPSVNSYTYYGQGGYGGYSDTNVSGDHGTNGWVGQAGAALICKFYQLKPTITSISVSGNVGTDYSITNVSGTVVAIIYSNQTVTINNSIIGASILLVGGGGAGGAGASGTSGSYVYKLGGGGGEGGSLVYYSNITLSSGSYSVTIGSGGIRGTNSGTGGTTTFSSYSASGGFQGSDTTVVNGVGGNGGTGGGNGGNGGKGGTNQVLPPSTTISNIAPSAGTNGTGYSIGGTNYYFSGGGGGGGTTVTSNSTGGLGGGGGGDTGANANTTSTYTFPDGTTRTLPSFNGMPNTGGGGAGATTTGSTGVGGSGVFIIWF